MKDNDFKIIFGSETNEVDIETLIGNLMYTSNIIQEVNRSLQTEKSIEVKIKALEKGSFEIHIELVEKLLNSLFSLSSITYASAIVTVVGGLYKFAEFLGGSKPKNIEERGDSVKVTNSNGDVTIVNGDVFTIFNENKLARDSIAKQFSLLEKNDDITGFTFESNFEKTYIPENGFDAISKRLDSLDEFQKDPISEIVEDKKLLIVRPSFTKDLKWDFVFEGQKISAKMDDKYILTAIDNGEQFAKGDFMVVDLEISKFYNQEYDTHMITKDSYKILKYKGHIQGSKQTKLF